jgi:hypothetical protein
MLPRAEHPTRARIARELQLSSGLSKYDLELRCHLAMNNVNAYLKIMHADKEIYISGYRRDTPHGPATKLWAYGNKKDAPRPKAMTGAERRRKQRQDPEVCIKEMMNQRRRRFQANFLI